MEIYTRIHWQLGLGFLVVLLTVGLALFRHEKATFRDYLIQQIRLLRGAEKAYVIDRYKHVGFRDQDIRNCRSRSWGTRLGAVIRFVFSFISTKINKIVRLKKPMSKTTQVFSHILRLIRSDSLYYGIFKST